MILFGACFYFAHPCFRIVLHIFADCRASYSVQLSLCIRSMDDSDILDEACLYDELDVDDGWAADSDSGDSGEEKVD